MHLLVVARTGLHDDEARLAAFTCALPHEKSNFSPSTKHPPGKSFSACSTHDLRNEIVEELICFWQCNVCPLGIHKGALPRIW